MVGEEFLSLGLEHLPRRVREHDVEAAAKKTPVNDFFAKNGSIRADGRTYLGRWRKFSAVRAYTPIKLEENKNLFLLRFDAGNVLGSVAIAR